MPYWSNEQQPLENVMPTSINFEAALTARGFWVIRSKRVPSTLTCQLYLAMLQNNRLVRRAWTRTPAFLVPGNSQAIVSEAIRSKKHPTNEKTRPSKICAFSQQEEGGPSALFLAIMMLSTTQESQASVRKDGCVQRRMKLVETSVKHHRLDGCSKLMRWCEAHDVLPEWKSHPAIVTRLVGFSLQCKEQHQYASFRARQNFHTHPLGNGRVVSKRNGNMYPMFTAEMWSANDVKVEGELGRAVHLQMIAHIPMRRAGRSYCSQILRTHRQQIGNSGAGCFRELIKLYLAGCKLAKTRTRRAKMLKNIIVNGWRFSSWQLPDRTLYWRMWPQTTAAQGRIKTSQPPKHQCATGNTPTGSLLYLRLVIDDNLQGRKKRRGV
jgi:hypothetical protein